MGKGLVMANYPLAALMGAFGNISNVVGKHYGDQAALKQKLKLYSEMDAANRPGEEAQKQRMMIMGMGLDPDTLEPIPGYFEALEQRKQIEAKYRKGKGDGKKKRRKRRGGEETTAAPKTSWLSRLFNG